MKVMCALGPVLGVVSALAAPANAAPGLSHAPGQVSQVSPLAQAAHVSRFADGSVVVHATQVSPEGIPVWRGRSVERRDARGRVVFSLDDRVARLPPSLAHVDALDATARATRALQADWAQGSSAWGDELRAQDARLVYWSERGEARLAWYFAPQRSVDHARYQVFIDAQDGHTLEARSLVRSADAQVYATNPSRSTLALRPMPLATGGSLDNPFLRAFNCIDRKTVRLLDNGVRAHVCDLEQTVTADASGAFLADPVDTPGLARTAQDGYSELSIYYHTARAYAFFQALQGDASAQIAAAKPLSVVANFRVADGYFERNATRAANPDLPLVPFSNAFFSPGPSGFAEDLMDMLELRGGTLIFGQGARRDFAYDGDVVYHELGHAVMHQTLGLGFSYIDDYGLTLAPGAMDEALADYFAAALSGDPNIGEYAAGERGLPYIRTLANDHRCPTHVSGGYHTDSTLFSGALWSARESLPEADRGALDRALYKAMRTAPRRENMAYHELAQLFIDLVRVEMPAGAAALQASMTNRGVLPACTRVHELEGDKRVVAPLDRGTYTGFASIGRASTRTEIAPGILQVSRALPEGAKRVTVSLSIGQRTQGSGMPYKPALLLQWNRPIRWSPAGQHDAQETGALYTNKRNELSFDVPADATRVYVQVVNEGDADGAYDDLGITVDVASPSAPPPPPNAPAPVASAPAGEGCAASPSPPSAWWAIGLALVGVALSRSARPRSAPAPSRACAFRTQRMRERGMSDRRTRPRESR